jgi:hypothetical protein
MGETITGRGLFEVQRARPGWRAVAGEGGLGRSWRRFARVARRYSGVATTLFFSRIAAH